MLIYRSTAEVSESHQLSMRFALFDPGVLRKLGSMGVSAEEELMFSVRDVYHTVRQQTVCSAKRAFFPSADQCAAALLRSNTS